MVYDKVANTISPMTAENLNTTERWETNYFDALIKFFKAVFELIKTKLTEA